MPIADPDILFVAHSLVRRYGDEAKRHALERISDLLDDGDAEACELWQKVAGAIDDLPQIRASPPEHGREQQ
jgi:hypothetical protein